MHLADGTQPICQAVKRTALAISERGFFMKKIAVRKAQALRTILFGKGNSLQTTNDI